MHIKIESTFHTIVFALALTTGTQRYTCFARLIVSNGGNSISGNDVFMEPTGRSLAFKGLYVFD